ncbi:MAG: NfeD family protein [Acidimicrobiia bacterium]
MARITSGLALIGVVLLALFAGPAAAQTNTPDESEGPGFINIIEVSGLLDPILANFIETSIADSEASSARYLVINLNSSGSVISNSEFVALARRIQTSTVPVGIWVGPSGSEAKGLSAQLLGVVDSVGVPIGSRIGETGPQVLPEDEFGVLFGEHAATLESSMIGSERVLEYGIAAAEAPTLGDFAVTLPGFETQEIEQDGRTVLEPRTAVRFSELQLIDQLLHTVASPPVTYLLLGIGLALIVFEFFTAAIGIAGMVGAASVLLASYGLWVLPVRWWAVAAILLAFVVLSSDVQIGVPRGATGAGLVLFGIGTVWFYDGVSVSWITLGGAIVSVALLFFFGMPTMVRTRFSTPSIDRGWLVGEAAIASGQLDPTGLVIVRGAQWRARSRSGALSDGDLVVVVAIDGTWLEVEPARR